MSNIVNILGQRGLLSQSSLEVGELADKLGRPVTLYAGFDPTADSLHIGHLLQIMVLISGKVLEKIR